MPRTLLLLLLPLLQGAVPVPLSIHLSVAEPEGAKAWIDGQVAVACQRYAAAGGRFEVRQRLSFGLPGPQITDVPGRNVLARQLGRDHTIHVFVVDRLANKDLSGAWIGGVHWRHRGRRYIIISRSEALPDTLAHELGHYFGLSHTRTVDNLMTSPGRRDGVGLDAGQLRRVRARLRSWIPPQPPAQNRRSGVR